MGLQDTELFSGCKSCTGETRTKIEQMIGDVKLCDISLGNAQKINDLIVWIDRFQGMIQSSLTIQEALQLKLMEASKKEKNQIQKSLDSMRKQSDQWSEWYLQYNERLNTLLEEIKAQ